MTTCAWWRLRPDREGKLSRHTWSIVKTRPHLPSSTVPALRGYFCTFAWEVCGRCGVGRIHEFRYQWLDQYPLWED